MGRFPHLDSSNFPNVGNVDVYKYDNEFDYSRYDAVQMDITVCQVPWDMGEAHIGNRTISGIGNVVFFGTKEKRDEWFAAIPDDECYRFTTKSRELHRDNIITVPVPFNVASMYNYVYVHHHELAADGSPVEYESLDGIRDWFYFVREVEFLAPNSTRLHLLPDAWQTFIYDIEIPYMQLERGHAPLFEVKASDYISNPIAKCSGLLSEDSIYGETDIAASQFEKIYNDGNMLAIMFTSADMKGNWGVLDNTENWQVPTSHNLTAGAGAYHAFGIDAGRFAAFLDWADINIPQLQQTLQGVAFVSSSLVTKTRRIAIGGNFELYELASDYRNENVHTLALSDFGYPYKYAELAKLYTYPYSFIRMSDNDGNEIDVRIENTNGKIELCSKLSLLYPYVNISAYLQNVGKAGHKTLRYRTAESMQLDVSGNWLQTLTRLDVPCFGAIQSAFVSNYFTEHWNYEQQRVSYENQYTNEIASADNDIANTAVRTAGNTAITARSNQSATEIWGASVAVNTVKAQVGNTITQNTAESQIQAAQMQGAIGAMGGLASGVAGALMGNPGALVSGIIGAVTTIAGTSVSTGLTQTQASYAVQSNNLETSSSMTMAQAQHDSQTSAQTDITATHNSVDTSVTANSAATAKANAGRSRDTAVNAVTNSVRASRLGNPIYNGTDTNGTDTATRPFGLFFTIMRQNDYAVERIGDEFLRYGYTYEKQWEFDGDWNIGKHFTYWKLSDFWVRNLKVPDMYVDRIRFFLFGGVTVWRVPEEIGNVSLYDNL